jgi:hypothetical protein
MKSLIVCIIFLFCDTSFSQVFNFKSLLSIIPNSESDFRGVNWGCTIDKVKKVEKSEYVKGEKILDQYFKLVYKTEICDSKATLFYYFDTVGVNGSFVLISGSYSVFAKIGDYKSQVSNFTLSLSSKYGKYVDEESDGNIQRMWKTKKTVITLVFSKEPESPDDEICINYDDKKEKEKGL